VGASAQYGLGWFYGLGKGVLQSYANAEKWYLLPNYLEEINIQEFIKISTKKFPVTSRKLVNSRLTTRLHFMRKSMEILATYGVLNCSLWR